MTAAQSRRLKARFLEDFRLCGNITRAARTAGLPHRTLVYDWQEKDEQFLMDYRQAELESIEILEEEARRRGADGVQTVTPIYHQGLKIGENVETKYSDTLLIFLLKARNPEKYRERWDVTQSDRPAVKAYPADVLESV